MVIAIDDSLCCYLLEHWSVTQDGTARGLVQVPGDQIAGAVPRVMLDLLLGLLAVMGEADLMAFRCWPCRSNSLRIESVLRHIGAVAEINNVDAIIDVG